MTNVFDGILIKLHKKVVSEHKPHCFCVVVHDILLMEFLFFFKFFLF